jgi:hypothetical protein
MNQASHRIRQQIEGRGSLADVTVCDAPASSVASSTRTPRAWIAAAERGIQSALAAIGTPLPQVSLWKLIGSAADTTDDAVEAAAFMATARLLDRADEFRLSRREGAWCVVRAEPG